MNSLDRRLERLENPSRGPMEGLAEALDRWTQRPGEPPPVATPEEKASEAAYRCELEARVAAGKRLTRWDEFALRFRADGIAP